MSWAAAAMTVSSTARRPSRRWRAHSNRQTVAAAARFNDSARPVIGTRTVASASARDLLGQTPRLVAEHERDGIGQVLLVQVALAVGVHREDAHPPRPERVDRRGGVGTADDRQVEQRARRCAHGLRVVHVDRGRGEHDRVGARGVRRPEHRPRVARVADLVQERHAGGVLGQVVERRRRRTAPPRRTPAGSPCEVSARDHVLAHVDRRDPGGARPFDQRVRGIRVEQRRDAARRRERLAEGLRPFDQERAFAFAERPLVELEGFRDLRVPDGGRCTAPSQPPGLGRERVLGGLDELAERGRIVHGHVGEDLAVDLDPGLASDRGRTSSTTDRSACAAGADPRDPQAAELRLAVSTVAVGVHARVEELLLGDAVALASATRSSPWPCGAPHGASSSRGPNV